MPSTFARLYLDGALTDTRAAGADVHTHPIAEMAVWPGGEDEDPPSTLRQHAHDSAREWDHPDVAEGE